MMERGFMDRAFRMTGRDLFNYGIDIVFAVVIFIAIANTAHDLIGPFAGLGETRVLDIVVLPIVLATFCGMFLFRMRGLAQWLQKRSVPPEGGGDEAAEAA